jgi:hypothetical protein
MGALPTVATGGGSLRGKSAADAAPTKANVAATARINFVMNNPLFHGLEEQAKCTLLVALGRPIPQA